MENKENQELNKQELSKQGKLPMHLISPLWNEGLAKVMKFGAEKHGVNSWLKDPMKYNHLIGAYKRHLNAWERGMSLDEESNQNHLLHAATNILMIYHYESSLNHNAIDDRVFDDIYLRL